MRMNIAINMSTTHDNFSAVANITEKEADGGWTYLVLVVIIIILTVISNTLVVVSIFMFDFLRTVTNK